MNTVLNFISIVSAFIFGVGIMYWVMDVTIGKLKVLHSDKEWYGLQVKDIFFLFTSVILLISFFKFYKPY